MWIIVQFVTLTLAIGGGHSLLYPKSTSLGLVASVSVPVTEYLPERRFIVDWCFQMSYDMPYQLSSFYNIPIWPGKHSPIKGRKRSIVPSNAWSLEHHWNSIGALDNSTAVGRRHPSDFTAGELYRSIEDLLVSYGFDETCLLRAVCELAKHPFDADNQGNILTDVITFILTPSQHEGFDPTETLYRQTYEDAERSGFVGENCASLYPKCESDLLSLLSYTEF
ncbi:uncharacterized protein LOC101887415 [Musca domestica]|uniref:Uncharacterized protein LOC101887415 n=1 Tax=Musca domestica TaxID=7370 RepID=A0A1I8MVM9_MUSDO|nr:uncharacterized protein LOC101887415 [Musca domestica]